MISFLSWNLNNKPLQSVIANIALRHSIDILVFSECSIPISVLLKELNRDMGSTYYYSPGIGCKKIEIFTRFSPRFIRPIFESDRLTIRKLTLPGTVDILLAGVHFISKLHWSEDSQTMECVELSSAIKDAERRVGHSRTILLGDLNMNPFEAGVVSANGLHGVMSRQIASRRVRIVQKKEYPFFYNPMWNFFGDEPESPPGTYYYSSSEHKTFFWNIFDQVLIRPDLLPFYDGKGLEIVDSDGHISLLSANKVPDATNLSDHLPVLLRLGI
jgi:hypothetical protein